MIFKNAHLTLNSVDLSAYVSSVEPSFDPEMQDDTVMGDDARSNAPGLLNWTMSVEFKDPFASSGPDATLGPLVLAGTTFAVVFRPDAGTVAATNPEYQLTGAITSWRPVGGSVGDEGVGTLSLVSASGSVPVRDVTP